MRRWALSPAYENVRLSPRSSTAGTEVSYQVKKQPAPNRVGCLMNRYMRSVFFRFLHRHGDVLLGGAVQGVGHGVGHPVGARAVRVHVARDGDFLGDVVAAGVRRRYAVGHAVAAARFDGDVLRALDLGRLVGIGVLFVVVGGVPLAFEVGDVHTLGSAEGSGHVAVI